MFFDIFDTNPHPPPHPSLKSCNNWVSSWGRGGLGASGPKTHWRMHSLDKIIILQGLNQQSLEVGYANRAKKAQNGGVCGIFPYIRGYLEMGPLTPAMG